MKRRISILSLALVSFAVACATPVEEETATTSSRGSALNVGGSDVPGHWARAVECSGAHFDQFWMNDGNRYDNGAYWQLVITDRGAVDYLNGKIAEQKRSPLGLQMIDASNAPHGPNEVLLYLGQITGSGWREGARQETFGTWTGLGYNEGQISVSRFSTFVDRGSNNFFKANDMKVTYQHSGWSDPCTFYEEATGICRSYASGGSEPRPGWSPFEISNWVFRGCHNLY